MTDIKLVEVSQGWDWFSIPDDITIQIEFEQDYTCVDISLQDLFLIYYLILEEESDSLIVGTGLNVSIVKGNVLIGDEVTFEEYGSAEESFESIIFRIFSEKDKIDPENREKALSEIDNRLQSEYGGHGLNSNSLYKEYEEKLGSNGDRGQDL